MMRAGIWLLALLSLMGNECNVRTPQEKKEGEVSLQAFACAHDDQLSDADKETLRLIDLVLEETPNCPTLGGPETEWPESVHGFCSIDEETFSAKEAHDWSKGQRILLIDEGMHRLAFTRYKRRVLDFVESDSFGSMVTVTTRLKMHRGERLISSEVIGEGNPYMPARKLNGLSRFSTLAKKFPNFTILGHGTPIFGILAEHNPKAEFVVAQLSNLIAEPFLSHFCSPSEDSLKQIESLYNNASQTLLELVRKYDINFIQYAGDATFDAFSSQFTEACKAIPNLQKADWISRIQNAHLKYYFQPFTSVPGVILVQAGASAPYKLKEGDRNFLMDCASLPNRLRVGSLNMLAPELPIEGSNNYELLSVRQRNAEVCVDIFINSGVNSDWYKTDRLSDWQAAPHAIKFTDYGMVEHVYMGLTPSWASPVALSYLIYLKKTLPHGTTTEELLAHANNHGHGKMKDPAFYAQFDKCRYGSASKD